MDYLPKAPGFHAKETKTKKAPRWRQPPFRQSRRRNSAVQGTWIFRKDANILSSDKHLLGWVTLRNSFARNRPEFLSKYMTIQKVGQRALTEGSLYDSKMTEFAQVFVSIAWTSTKHQLLIDTLRVCPRRSSFPKGARVERWGIVFVEDQIAGFVLSLIEDQAFFDESLQTHFFINNMTWTTDSQFVGIVSI